MRIEQILNRLLSNRDKNITDKAEDHQDSNNPEDPFSWWYYNSPIGFANLSPVCSDAEGFFLTYLISLAKLKEIIRLDYLKKRLIAADVTPNSRYDNGFQAESSCSRGVRPIQRVKTLRKGDINFNLGLENEYWHYSGEYTYLILNSHLAGTLCEHISWRMSTSGLIHSVTSTRPLVNNPHWLEESLSKRKDRIRVNDVLKRQIIEEAMRLSEEMGYIHAIIHLLDELRLPHNKDAMIRNSTDPRIKYKKSEAKPSPLNKPSDEFTINSR